MLLSGDIWDQDKDHLVQCFPNSLCCGTWSKWCLWWAGHWEKSWFGGWTEGHRSWHREKKKNISKLKRVVGEWGGLRDLGQEILLSLYFESYPTFMALKDLEVYDFLLSQHFEIVLSPEKSLSSWGNPTNLALFQSTLFLQCKYVGLGWEDNEYFSPLCELA